MLDIRLIRLPNANVPYLLASASKKSGSAVARNKFRRRVRMAFLEILKKRQGAVDNGFALWVRPSKWSPSGCLVEYREIEKQLEQSLNRLRNP
jgi:ribonuclease P protein component